MAQIYSNYFENRKRWYEQRYSCLDKQNYIHFHYRLQEEAIFEREYSQLFHLMSELNMTLVSLILLNKFHLIKWKPSDIDILIERINGR